MMMIRTHVRLAAYYFLFFTMIAAYGPYFSLYLSARGLSGKDIGFAMAVIPLVGLFAQPLWGLVIDRYRIERWLVPTGLVLSVLILLALQKFSHLYWYFVAIAAFAFFQTGINPVVDSLTVRMTGIADYGKVRLFGSLGWALSAWVVSFVYHRFGVEALPSVYMFTGVLALLGWLAYPKFRLATATGPVNRGASHWHGFGRVMRNKRFLLVLVVTSLVTTSQAMNANFFTLYYHDLGHPMRWLGVIYALGAVFELPFLFFVGRLLTRYGPGRVFLIGAVVYALRWFILSLAPPTFILLIVQLSHGISFGFTFSAGVAIASGVSDEHTRATAQTLYSAFNTGVAVIAGSILGGLTLTAYGPTALYRVASLVAVVGIVMMMVLVRRWGDVVEPSPDQQATAAKV